MRNVRAGLLLILALSLLWVMAGAEEAETTVYMEKTSVQVTQGGYGWIRTRLLNLRPGVLISSMSWESTDESVVRIGDDSKYIAVGKGTAQLIRRWKTNDGQEYTGICNVQVVIPVDRILTDVTQLTLVAGKQSALPEVQVLPEDADIRTCTWSVNHPEIAEIRNGAIHALSPGVAVLTATSDERIDKHMLRTCTLQVTVIPAIESIELEGIEGSIRLEAGKKQSLTVQIRPDGIAADVLHYASSSEDIVCVSPDGSVTGIAPGHAAVTVWTDQTLSGEKLERSLEVEVFRPVQKITFAQRTLTAFRGQTVLMEPQISPADADTSGLILSWSTDQPYIAGVTGSLLTGLVECRQVGQSRITVRAEDGSRKSAALRLTVEPTIPAAIREASASRQADQLQLEIRFKNRMRSTHILGIGMRYTFRDTEGMPVRSWEAELPFALSAAKFGTAHSSIPLADIPETAVLLEMTVTGITYAQGFYAIPDELQTGYEVHIQ